MTYNIIFGLVALLGGGFGYFQWQLRRKEITKYREITKRLRTSNDIKNEQIRLLSAERTNAGKLLKDGDF
jgi:hypothetical protein